MSDISPLHIPAFAEVVGLSRTLSPVLVAEYQTRLPDKAMLRARLELMGEAGPEHG